MADEISVAVRKILDTFEASPETFLEVAVADTLRSATTTLKPSSQTERDIWWSESAAMRFYRG
jgi:hypothetical protein